MKNLSALMVFWTIVGLTTACGFGAGYIAVFSSLNETVHQSVDQLFATLTHIFASGVGAIFTLMATR